MVALHFGNSQGFNAAGIKPNAALLAIPSGQYPVIITKSEEKPTKNGAGSYIEFEMTIQGGEYAGRKLYDRLNINNPNQTAVDIAYATLSAICHVTGRLQIQDTAQLHGVPFIAVVNKRVRDDLPPPPPGEQPQYSNEVKGYKDINGNDPGFAGNSQAPAAATPAWAGGNGQPAAAPPQQQPTWNAPPANGGAPPSSGQPAWANNVPQTAAAPANSAPAAAPPQQMQQPNNSPAPPWASQPQT